MHPRANAPRIVEVARLAAEVRGLAHDVPHELGGRAAGIHQRGGHGRAEHREGGRRKGAQGVFKIIFALLGWNVAVQALRMVFPRASTPGRGIRSIE